MNIEQKVSQKLNQYPGIKQGIKAVYQHSMYMLSPKIKSEGDITRISPDDGDYEYFFGYYDKSPEDATGQYILCLRAENTWSNVAPAVPAQILLIDTAKGENEPGRVRVLATTHAWNVQQGCMMQWVGPDFDHDIIYNDYRNGEYVSVILNVFSGEEKVLKAPIYSVSQDGCFALTLDFSRLHRLRPGYGYSNKADITASQKLPNSTAIWRLDLHTNSITKLLTYTDFANFEPRPEMNNAEHKINHIMLNPSGERFMVLHRWVDGQRKYTRLVTVNTDGTGMYNLSDDDMVSHCYWKDNRTIIAFENKKGQGAGYYLMTDMSQSFKHLWPHLCNDGHPSYSPDGSIVVTDTYPDRMRIASIKVMQGSQVKVLAKVFSPFKYDNETRCDLHPRWSRDGKNIYFDSVYEGNRGLYRVPCNLLWKKRETIEKLVSVIIPTYKRSETLLRAIQSALDQTYQSIEILVVDDNTPNDEFSLAVQEKLNALSDERVRYVQQKKHINGSAARNAGIDVAKGEYIAFLDDDDIWYPDKLERQIGVFAADPSVGLVYTGSRAVYVNDQVSYSILPKREGDLSRLILIENCIGTTSSVIVKKDVIINAGKFDTQLPALQDYDLWIRICQLTKIGLVKSIEIDYYNIRDEGQISSNTGKYEAAFARLDEKYRALHTHLSPLEKRKNQEYKLFLLANKALRNNDRKKGQAYLKQLLIGDFNKKGVVMLLLSPFDYKLILRVRKLL